MNLENEIENQGEHGDSEEIGVGLNVSNLEDAKELSRRHGAEGRKSSDQRIYDKTVCDVEECRDGILKNPDEDDVEFVDLESIGKDGDVDRIAVFPFVKENGSRNAYDKSYDRKDRGESEVLNEVTAFAETVVCSR